MVAAVPETAPSRNDAKITRSQWIDLAKERLIADGVESVRVLALAEELGASRSSFYWHFKSRQDLLNQLLTAWEETNTQAIVQHARRPAETIIRAVLNVFECWVDQRLFNPELDFAVREWGRRSKDVEQAMERADGERLLAIRDMYRRHGYDDENALIRARVLYYMQIGYYVIGPKEPMKVRLTHLNAYLRSFTGEEPAQSDLADFAHFVESVRRRDFGRKGKSPDLSRLELLRDAIMRRRLVALKYRRDREARLFAPHALYRSHPDVVSVTGIQHENPAEPSAQGAPRNFELDGIAWLEVTDRSFSPGPPIDPDNPKYRHGLLYAIRGK